MATPTRADEGIQVAAYYFPNYHADARNVARYGAGWDEWTLLRDAHPRFAGHPQPKVPAWGYEDEADPAVFARKIDAAADHGLDAFIFDWYAYSDGFFLDRALDEGYLRAPNVDRLKFALMWANHDWVEIFPARPDRESNVIYPGAVDRAAFERITQSVIERYFGHPSYWRIDGAPYFSVYELYRLVQGLGGLDAAREALRDFRRRAAAAGFANLHLNGVVWGIQVLPGEGGATSPDELARALELDSVSSYAWVHHVPLEPFPAMPYAAATDRAIASWSKLASQFNVPYYPNVSMGWDPSPRTAQDQPWTNRGYPYTPMLKGNTPAEFERALRAAKAWLLASPRAARDRILSINAWNEWTEGSYLEPDTVHGLRYLEAIRNVFG